MEVTKIFQAHGLRVKHVALQGRFHTPMHSDAAQRLVELCAANTKLQFPPIDCCRVPIRTTVDCKKITGDPLHKAVIDMIMLKTADWHGTMRKAAQEIPGQPPTLISVGGRNSIPPSIAQNSALQIIPLASIRKVHEGLSDNLPDLGAPSSSAAANREFGINKSIDTSSLANGMCSNTSVTSNLASNTSISDMSDHMKHIPSKIHFRDHAYPQHAVAVVGMSCRLPGADSVDEFWELLISGTSMVKPAPGERLGLDSLRGDEHVKATWWGNFLRDPDSFDHKFFKKSSREAGQYDPQQRVLLEVAYEAMESSGYFGTTSESPNDYGCYIGVVANNYYDNVSCHAPTAYSMLGTSRSFFTGRLSHYFGWTGPSLAIDTACSSSLVAINAACKAIQAGECSRAVAGGTNIFSSPFDYQNLAAAGFLSPTGACKPFDAAADGYCRGEGVAVVVLKPLISAIKENDNILGIITGSAVNQNENSNHITVPCLGSQSSVYQKVAAVADIDPHFVSYVEAHGTGTPVGDPIECQSIRDVFGSPSREEVLYLGSVKGHIGHTEATAGVAGLIKVLLMMQHSTIPAQASFSSLNPNISPLERDHMAIPTTTRKWDSSSRLACINSYGAAGSNAAIVVGPRPDIGTDTGVTVDTSALNYPLFISAATSRSLSSYCKKLLDYVKKRQDSNKLLSEVTFNLSDRQNFSLSQVLAATITDLGDLSKKLEAAASAPDSLQVQIPVNPMPLVLVFGGQEGDTIGISESFYQSCSLFRHHLDYCNSILIEYGLDGLYPTVFQHTPISNLAILHAGLLSVQYSCAKSWIDCGADVKAVIGHSFGHLTALCISGCLTIHDTLRLAIERASIIREYWGPERGSMVSLKTKGKDFSEILELVKTQGSQNDIEVACFNGTTNHVLVGSNSAIDKLEAFVRDQTVTRDCTRTQRLKVTHGFHSRFTDPLLPHLVDFAKQLDWREPNIHIESCTKFQDQQRQTPKTISDHTRLPVYFRQAVERLNQRFANCTWLEAGQGSSVIHLVRKILETHPDRSPLFLSPVLKNLNPENQLCEVTVKLRKAGHKIQYWLFHRRQKQKYRYIALPPYQFEKSKHWLPFKRCRQIPTPAKAIGEPAEKHELLSIYADNDKSQGEVKFLVDPQNERYRFLLNGHITAGQALAPSSLYFELVARAALSLHSTTASSTRVPCVEPLSMKASIGLDIDRAIFVVLNRINGSATSWSFHMYSRSKAGKETETTVQHASGRVHIQTRDDPQLIRRFVRYDSLIGVRKCEQILSHPEAEKMQGRHIYQAIRGIVHFDDVYKGIRSIAALPQQAAGVVEKAALASEVLDEKLCDSPMLDSMMQFAGLLVNYFTHPSDDKLLVCSQIERFEMGGGFDPEAGKWFVYAILTEDSEKQTLCDVYVFEAGSTKLVMMILGFSFFKASRASLSRILKDVNVSDGAISSATHGGSKPSPQPEIEASCDAEISESNLDPGADKPSDIRKDLCNLLCTITDVSGEELTDGTTLEDLGIDSLMANDVLNDIQKVFGVIIDMTTFLLFENIQAIVTHIQEKLNKDSVLNSGAVPKTPSDTLDMYAADRAFEEIQRDYDKIAVETQAADFWTKVYPLQRRLILAYVVAGYADLGCNLNDIKAGTKLPEIEHLAKHNQLKSQFDRILEDGGLISINADSSFRTPSPVDLTPAEDIFQEIVASHPKHGSVHKLVKVPGSEIANCLTGKKDALQLVFANKENKANLDDVYEHWPLVRTGTLLLGDFLAKAMLSRRPDVKAIRVLEIGAGTGGTTKYIVDHLSNRKIQFHYTFTDLSASLVTAAKSRLKSVENMEFKVLNVEVTPKDEDFEAYDFIISTNCIHATRDLKISLTNMRRMLRDGGVATLVEITRNMFWLDVAVGFFEGWWLFKDGRSHAITPETLWEKRMQEAGFRDMKWSSGERPESNTIRLLAGFK